MSGTTLLIAEWRGSELHPVTNDAALLARRLDGVRVVAGVLGPAPAPVTDALAPLVSEIRTVDGAELSIGSGEAACHACDELIRQLQPDWVVLPGSNYDLAPRLAARWWRSVIANCSAVVVEEDGPVFTRSIHQGRLVARVRPVGPPPHFLTVEPGSGATAADEVSSAQAAIEPLLFASLPANVATPLDEPVPFHAGSSSLRDAEVVVAVGRGIRSQEGVALAARLAELLGAELAGSRPVCDEGWIPDDHQIGSSGVTVAPRLYLALGVSGAIQHTMGMHQSRRIVAINRDPNAPIFRIADVAVVGDLGEILPELIRSLEQTRPT
ncbi:MAG: electron transfer flavoprotein subunit alpha/FixB family protein [Nitrospirota bacterium]|jgi:electron transfer flavoprotein alpha subunit